jgi:hypothetical protein
MDLSKLNDEEIKLLEQLMLKATGELVGDVVPAFKIEFVRQIIDSNAAEPTVHELKGLL